MLSKPSLDQNVKQSLFTVNFLSKTEVAQPKGVSNNLPTMSMSSLGASRKTVDIRHLGSSISKTGNGFTGMIPKAPSMPVHRSSYMSAAPRANINMLMGGPQNPSIRSNKLPTVTNFREGSHMISMATAVAEPEQKTATVDTKSVSKWKKGDAAPVMVGIAADSGCGKSTFMRRIVKTLGAEVTKAHTPVGDLMTVICLDDYHLNDR